jgi:hypothetical protein
MIDWINKFIEKELTNINTMIFNMVIQVAV